MAECDLPDGADTGEVLLDVAAQIGTPIGQLRRSGLSAVSTRAEFAEYHAGSRVGAVWDRRIHCNSGRIADTIVSFGWESA